MSRYVSELNAAASKSTDALSNVILTGKLDRVLEAYARQEVASAISVDANPIDNLHNLTTEQLAVALHESLGLDEDVIFYAGPSAADHVRRTASKEYWRQASC